MKIHVKERKIRGGSRAGNTEYAELSAGCYFRQLTGSVRKRLRMDQTDSQSFPHPLSLLTWCFPPQKPNRRDNKRNNDKEDAWTL